MALVFLHAAIHHVRIQSVHDQNNLLVFDFGIYCDEIIANLGVYVVQKYEKII